jgi:hypothetical protein
MMGAAVLLCAAAHARAQTATTAPAAPAHKGFVEGGLAYGYGMSNSQFIEVNNGTRLDSPRNGGPAIDVAGGFAFVPNLAIVGDLQYASDSTITGQNQDGDTEQLSDSYTSLAVGLRATVPLGHGEVYAQMGLGMVFPFETERDEHMANGDSRVTTVGYNSGLGGRGELGYHYALNDRMYLAGGVRVQAFATDNVGKERVRTDQPSGQVQRDVFTTSPSGNNNRQAEALSVQDMRLRIGFGYRF